MKKLILDYDSFVNEGYAPNSIAAVVFNTPGMGNVSSSSINTSFDDDDEDSGDGDGKAKHLKIREHGQFNNSWMGPSGDYSHRNWLVSNYEIFQNEKQSNARFQIGQFVKCINPMKESYGMVGKIIAFEDNTVRWEAILTKNGIGQNALQYRCHAQDLEHANINQANC